MHSDRTEPIETNKKQKFPIFKTISLAVSAVLIISSFVCFWRATKLARPFHELEVAQPIYMEVDVSEPGVYSCNINHSQHAKLVEHGADLLLVHESDLTFPEIFNDAGELINQFNLHNETHEAQTYRLGTEGVKGYPPMWTIYPFTHEFHELKLTITTPVKELANAKQTLEGYYLLCGMEFLASGLAGITGLILLGTGLLIVVTVLFVTYLRHKKARRALNKNSRGRRP